MTSVLRIAHLRIAHQGAILRWAILRVIGLADVHNALTPFHVKSKFFSGNGMLKDNTLYHSMQP